MKIIKDPVHGYVEADEPVLRLLDSGVVQRLRHVTQLGFANLVYPGANHTRFEHSLGTMHLAGLMCRELGLDDGETKLVTTAALLHDIGHGPFSHVTEPVMEEFVGRGHHQIDCLVREGAIADILEAEGIDPAEVCAVVAGKHRFASIIHGSLDVDRMDYLMRDAHYTGVPYGTVDAHRLIRCSVLAESGIALRESGINAAESLLIARTLMRPAVYFHHVSRIATSMFVHALREEVLNVPGTDARATLPTGSTPGTSTSGRSTSAKTGSTPQPSGRTPGPPGGGTLPSPSPRPPASRRRRSSWISRRSRGRSRWRSGSGTATPWWISRRSRRSSAP